MSIASELQGLVRKHPMALFTKSIIIGEGATEYGFIRGINEVRQDTGKGSLSLRSICAINGNGSECIKTAEQLISLGYRVSLICDSDVDDVNNQKDSLRNLGVEIFDCEDKLAFESQLFKDCPWSTLKKLIEYRISCDQTSKGVFENVKHKLSSPITYTEDWYEHESENLRTAIGVSAGNPKNPWFKKVEMGYDVALIILQDIELFRKQTNLYKTITALSEWIERS